MTNWDDEQSAFVLSDDQERLAALSDDELELGVEYDFLPRLLDRPDSSDQAGTFESDTLEPDSAA